MSSPGSTPAADLGAVIPVHNEARTVAQVVLGARRFCGAVVVFDDGSSDGSAERAAAAGAVVLRWPRRRGKGAAWRAALDHLFGKARQAGGELPCRRADPRRLELAAAILLDGDGQHLTAEIPRFVAAYREGADLVLGDRSAGFASMPFIRRLVNQGMTALLRPLASAGLRDSQCGFRLISARLYQALELTCGHFDADSELLIAARRRGACFTHVPVSVVYAGEESKIRCLPDAWRFFRLLLPLMNPWQLPDARS